MYLTNKSKKILNNQKGVSMVELVMVLVIISMLTAIGMAWFRDFYSVSKDATAMNDAQNIMKIVFNHLLVKADINFAAKETSASGTRVQIGTETTGAVKREPVFILSPGVRIHFDASDFNSSFSDGTPGSIHAWLYHTTGSEDRFNFCPSETEGKKCIELYVDEGENMTMLIVW